MRETGLIMRELLKMKLGQPASMPLTPTLDAGFPNAGQEATSQARGTPRLAENGPPTGALDLLHNPTENDLPNTGNRSTLGMGQPPQRPPIPQPNNPIGFSNGVTFNIGPITQPVTVAPLPPPDRKMETANASPGIPGSALPPEGHHHHPLQQPHFAGSSSGDPHPPSAPASTPIFRDASQPLMSDTPRNPSFPMPGQHTSIQTPQIPPTQHENQNMASAPSPVPPQGVHGYMLHNQAYANFPQGFVRPSLTPQQQQALHQHLQQQQQQAQIMAQLQRQAAMARHASPYYAQHQQIVGMHPSMRAASGNPTMGRPPRPFLGGMNMGLGIIPPGDEAERSASDPLPHGNQPRMSPNVQLERMQRQAMGYMRQMSGPMSTSPNNPTTDFPSQQFSGATATPSLQNPFLGAMGLSMSPPPANGVSAVPNSGAGGFGGGNGNGAPAPAPAAPSGAATNDMGTPNMYNLYAEPSPFSPTFAGVPGGGEINSPFSFAPPEIDAGGCRPRWGEEEEEQEEPLREVTPGKRFDSE